MEKHIQEEIKLITNRRIMDKKIKLITIFVFLAILIIFITIYLNIIKVRNETEIRNPRIPIEPLGAGNITILEFSDFQCPACKLAQPIVKQVMQKYSNDVKLYYKQFPLSIHKDSFRASLSSLCANEQGKFWQYHNILFENQDKLDKASLKNYAKQLNLNATQFNRCIDSARYKNKVNEDVNEGRELGIEGTPTFFVNGKKLYGVQSFDTFSRVIEGEIKNR